MLVKRLLNRSKDYLLFNPALERHWIAGARGKVTALLYHRVDDPAANAFLTRAGAPVIAPTAFEQELTFLRERGARFFTFAQLAAGDWPRADEMGIAVCFDDGFADNYTHGLDVLQRCDVVATFFQSTALIDATELLWEHRLYWHTRDQLSAAAFERVARRVFRNDPGLARLSGRALVEELRERVAWETCLRVLDVADDELSTPAALREIARRIYPTSDQIKHAHDAGHEIGSHGHRHLKRVNVSESAFERELVESGEVIERILGTRPQSFSYPFDSHKPTDAVVCKRHFRTAATVAKRRIRRDDDPMWLPRFTWPGPSKNAFRRRRWLLTGTI